MRTVLKTFVAAVVVLLAACDTPPAEQSAEANAEPEAWSLFGKALYPMELPQETRAKYDSNLVRAQLKFVRDPGKEENIIWLGRRTAYLGRYWEALRIYTRGLEKYPESYRLLRHRGQPTGRKLRGALRRPRGLLLLVLVVIQVIVHRPAACTPQLGGRADLSFEDRDGL